MMRRRLAIASGVSLLANGAGSQIHAQPVRKPVRVGYLSMTAPGADAAWVASFRQGLRDLGYVEGNSIVVEERHAAQDPDRIPRLLADLLRLEVAVIVSYGAHNHRDKLASPVPVVFTVDSDPIGTGLVASLARPGGNFTGLTDAHSDLVPKRLSLLKEAIPAARRVAVLYSPQIQRSALQFRAALAIAPSLGLVVVPAEVVRPGELGPVLASLTAQTVDSLFIIPDPSWAIAGRALIADHALRHRMPGIGTVREFAEAGLLLAYGANFHDLWRRAAFFVDRILKGAKPGELPVEQPTKFHLALNARAARTLNIEIPIPLLSKVDEVIE